MSLGILGLSTLARGAILAPFIASGLVAIPIVSFATLGDIFSHDSLLYLQNEKLDQDQKSS